MPFWIVSYLDLFAMIGMMSYLVGSALVYSNEGHRHVEVVEAEESDPRLSGTSSEQPRWTDGAQPYGKTGESVPDARTASRKPAECMSCVQCTRDHGMGAEQ